MKENKPLNLSQGAPEHLKPMVDEIEMRLVDDGPEMAIEYIDTVISFLKKSKIIIETNIQ